MAAAGPLGLLVGPGERRYSFRVEWTDSATGMLRTFKLVFFEKDDTVEMTDQASRKVFLKRCVPPERITLDAFVLGSTVTILSRPLKICAYLDEETLARFSTGRSSTCALIKPDGLPYLGELVQLIEDSGLTIERMRLVRLSRDEASEFYAGAAAPAAVDFLTVDAVLALQLSAEDSVLAWQRVAGPANPEDARDAARGSIRCVPPEEERREHWFASRSPIPIAFEFTALAVVRRARYGTDRVRNVVHCSATPDAAARELDFFFERERTEPAVFDNCAALIIKPHAVAARATGAVLSAVLAAGLEISGVRTRSLERADIEDFLEAYKGVVPEYGRWIVELSEGRSVILEVRGEDVVARLRELCGPYDPVIARVLRPESLRAKLGLDSVRNALHCTDLPLDGPLECKFLFTIVA